MAVRSRSRIHSIIISGSADPYTGRSCVDAVHAPDGDRSALGHPSRSSPYEPPSQDLARRQIVMDSASGNVTSQSRQGRSSNGPRKSGTEGPEKAEIEIVPVSSTGTAVFLAAILSGLLLGVSPVVMASSLVKTVLRMTPAIVAILAMLSLGFVTKYSGMDAVLGLAFTRTGPILYPIFGTLLGWLGVALTGSDTSSNVLFGNLQTDHCSKAWPERSVDGFSEYDGRCHGQDDRCPVDRRRRRRDRGWW